MQTTVDIDIDPIIMCRLLEHLDHARPFNGMFAKTARILESQAATGDAQAAAELVRLRRLHAQLGSRESAAAYRAVLKAMLGERRHAAEKTRQVQLDAIAWVSGERSAREAADKSAADARSSKARLESDASLAHLETGALQAVLASARSQRETGFRREWALAAYLAAQTRSISRRIRDATVLSVLISAALTVLICWFVFVVLIVRG